MRWALAVLFLLAAVIPGQAAERSAGFDHFYNLEYDEALKFFERQAIEQPANPDAHNHVAQTLLFREMLRSGSLESEMVSRNNPFLRRANMNPSPQVAREFEANIASAMKLCEDRIAEEPLDWRAKYALGVSHGLRANFNWLVRKAWRDALKDATAARKLHEDVVEIQPQFIDANLVLGLHNYLIGSLPWHYRALGFLAGFRGDREAGLNQLKLVAQRGELNRFDAQVFLAGIYRREHRPEEAIPLVQSLIAHFPRNYLFRLELALMYQDLGMNDRALAELDAVEQMKRANSTAFRSLAIEKVYYYRANVYFWSNELDLALEQMKRVTPAAATLDLNTGVMAWMRLGQIYDLRGQREKALAAYRRAIALAPDSDPAKESKEYLGTPYKRS